MSVPLKKIIELLTAPRATALTELFTELGWDHARGVQVSAPSGVTGLDYVAQKRGYQVISITTATLPLKAERDRIEKAIQRQIPNKLLIYTDGAERVWQFSTRDSQRKRITREFHESRERLVLAQFLARMEFGLDQEEELTLVDVLQLVNPVAAVERVTKKFYEEFKKQHDVFMGFIDGIPDEQLQRWYASVMLNRLMFIYFLQKKQFVAGDVDYLKHKLTEHPKGYYKQFLCPLFFDGFAKKFDERSPESIKKLGKVPYLNGGIFNQHQIEQLHGQDITIADTAFEKIFAFFDGWTWHLDDRQLSDSGNEINPDVLGYIFEKYINQRQMGAYYTKEDITEYICRSTIVPFLIDHVATPADWTLLQTDPERYIFEPVLRGLDLDLPAHIAAGVDDVAQRTQWNTPTADAYKLPTEIWRETVARRHRASALIAMLQAGEVTASNQLITHNLDVRRFLLDVIAQADAGRVMQLWERLQTLSVLDPTVGSGAFLFAALTILTPVYVACIDRLAVLERDGALGKVAEAAHDMQRDLKAHKSLSYTVLKRIMVNNLYGVDIMEEAVEICKLRLFLKLTAQISELGELEPLPDIDFNIRAGNTLVGYARLADAGMTQAGRTKAMDLFATEEPLKKQLTLVKEQAATYRTNQANLGASYADKQALAAQMTATAEVLNLRLADAYGVDVRDARAYAQWKTSHKPFHWCSEFYDIVEERGGFDVIVGNPPYVAKANAYESYSVKGYQTAPCPDIYANVMERCTHITRDQIARFGVIVPLNLMFSGDFKTLRLLLESEFGSKWFSAYDIWPAGLFDGVGQRCTIVLCEKGVTKSTMTSQLHRWVSAARGVLFDKLVYQNYNAPLMTEIPRLRSSHKAATPPNTGNRLLVSAGYEVHFPTAANLFTPFTLIKLPTITPDTFEQLNRSKMSSIRAASQHDLVVLFALCCGDMHFTHWLIHGDAFDVTKGVVTRYVESIQGVLTKQHMTLLYKIGSNIACRHQDALFISKYNGLYIGSYYWGALEALTRRADFMIAIASGYSLEQYDDIVGSVDISRSASNVASQRNTIPESVVEAYRTIIDAGIRTLGLTSYPWSEIDRDICNLVGINELELNAICGSLTD